MKPHKRLMQSLADITNWRQIQRNAEWNFKMRRYHWTPTPSDRKERREKWQALHRALILREQD